MLLPSKHRLEQVLTDAPIHFNKERDQRLLLAIRKATFISHRQLWEYVDPKRRPMFRNAGSTIRCAGHKPTSMKDLWKTNLRKPGCAKLLTRILIPDCMIDSFSLDSVQDPLPR